MNYDQSISTEVSLSKVLDELLTDGTPLETIVQFLKSHESQIGEIYAHSAFVYDLYDLAAHPYRVNEFLAMHLKELGENDRWFALTTILELLVHEDIHPTLRKELRREARAHRAGRRYFFGLDEDKQVVAGDLDFTKLVNSCAADPRDMRSFLLTSRLARSAFMAGNFLEFAPSTQFMILNCAKEIIEKSILPGFDYTFPHMLNTLLKQLLVLGQTEMFNWVSKVLGFQSKLGELFNDLTTGVRGMMMEDAWKSIPSHFIDKKGPETFEETVFDMNMMETQFDVLDLFLYIYLFDHLRFKGMLEYPDLLEFFNLPFKWEELEKLKGVGETATEGGSYASEV